MPLVDNAWYVDFGDGATTGYYAVTAWAALTTKVCGDLIRQSAAPSVGNERTFVCTASTGGTGATGAAEPTWTVTRGALNTDATVTWQEATGIAALNGDKTNTPTWNTVKNTAVVLGQVIQSVNGNFVLIATVAGTAGNGAEPTWAAFTNAGATTADNTVTWVTLKDSGNNFGNWATPHARLANAFATNWGQSGNSFYVASEHAETQSSAITLTAPGATTTTTKILCVTKTAVPPTSSNITTGATISTTGASAISYAGTGYYYGLSFLSGSAGSVANQNIGSLTGVNLYFVNCAFTLNNTSGSSRIVLGASGGSIAIYTTFFNCTFTFGSTTSQGFNSSVTNNNIYMKNCVALFGASTPATLFVGGSPAFLLCEGCDFSGQGSGKTLIGNTTNSGILVLKDCSLPSSYTIIASAPPSNFQQKVFIIRSDSSGTNYRQEFHCGQGSHVAETTIVRTGGATDGATPISWKLVTSTQSAWQWPLECIPLSIWNTVTGSNVTVTIYGTWGDGAVPNNDDIWIDVEYPGSASTPLGSFKTTTKADVLATGSALSSDGSTWGGGTTPFKIVATLSSPQPAMLGPITIYVKAAKASSTFYIDPKPVLS